MACLSQIIGPQTDVAAGHFFAEVSVGRWKPLLHSQPTCERPPHGIRNGRSPLKLFETTVETI
jgi:hypothetical protein